LIVVFVAASATTIAFAVPVTFAVAISVAVTVAAVVVVIIAVDIAVDHRRIPILVDCCYLSYGPDEAPVPDPTLPNLTRSGLTGTNPDRPSPTQLNPHQPNLT
jgi:hypothetical protein